MAATTVSVVKVHISNHTSFFGISYHWGYGIASIAFHKSYWGHIIRVHLVADRFG